MSKCPTQFISSRRESTIKTAYKVCTPIPYILHIIPDYPDACQWKSVEDAYREIAKNTLYLDVIINCVAINMISPLIENSITNRGCNKCKFTRNDKSK